MKISYYIEKCTEKIDLVHYFLPIMIYDSRNDEDIIGYYMGVFRRRRSNKSLTCNEVYREIFMKEDPESGLRHYGPPIKELERLVREDPGIIRQAAGMFTSDSRKEKVSSIRDGKVDRGGIIDLPQINEEILYIGKLS